MNNQHEPATTLTGPAMQMILKQAGIDAQKVERRRETGFYVADFFFPGMEMPVQSAREWARKMLQRVGGLKIVDTSDTVADWRSDRPIIWASVTFALSSPEAAPKPAAARTGWASG